MLCRWHVLLLILVTLTAFCGLAAAKLRATPKYDRIQVGMQRAEVQSFLGWENSLDGNLNTFDCGWECDEGRILLTFSKTDGYGVSKKHITRRSPLQRLTWVAGWR